MIGSTQTMANKSVFETREEQNITQSRIFSLFIMEIVSPWKHFKPQSLTYIAYVYIYSQKNASGTLGWIQ